MSKLDTLLHTYLGMDITNELTFHPVTPWLAHLYTFTTPPLASAKHHINVASAHPS